VLPPSIALGVRTETALWERYGNERSVRTLGCWIFRRKWRARRDSNSRPPDS